MPITRGLAFSLVIVLVLGYTARIDIEVLFVKIERCGDREALLGRATASGEVLIKDRRGTREGLTRNHKLRNWRSEIRECM